VTVKETLAAALEPYTLNTVTGAAALEAELASVRERGWAATIEELEIGLNALAAPIQDGTGEVVAAVGVSGPSYRLTVESFPDAAAHLLAAAREISTRLGWFGPEPVPTR
jgi:DNA-binding IclR family transcriptional regulator